MKEYYIKVWERWEFGKSWGFKVSTNNIDSLRKQLTEQYNRVTITEIKK